MNQSWLKYLPKFISKHFEGRFALQKMTANSGWLLFDQFLKIILGLLVGVWVARYLGPADFGKLSYCLALIALLVPFSKLGLDGIGVKELVNVPEETNKTMGTILLLRLVGGVFLVCLSYLLISTLRPDDFSMQVIVVIVSIGYIARALEVNDLWFKSQVKSKYSVISQAIALIASASIKVFFILTGMSLLYFAGAFFIESVLIALCLVVSYHFYGNGIKGWEFSLDKAKHLLKLSWPMIFSGLFVVIYLEIDKIMIGQMLGDGAVGQYSVAVTATSIFYMIPSIVISSVFPYLLKDRESNKDLYYLRLQQLFSLLVGVSYFISITVAFSAPYIINFLYGAEYEAAINILTVQIFSLIFIYLGQGRTPWVMAEEFTMLPLVANMIGAVLNVIMNYFFIEEFGIIGATYSTLITFSITSVLINVFFKKSIRIFKMQLKALFLFSGISMKQRN